MYIKRRKGLKKKFTLAVVVLLVVVGGYLAYAKSANIWPLKSYQSDTPTISEPKINQPSSDKETAQKNETNQTQGDGTTAGTGIVDSDTANVDKNQTGISSDSGAITLFTPKKAQKLSSGVFVEGKSTLNTVQYRLKDNLQGVIGQGQLVVKSGIFSGKLQIHTSASEGTLEIYSFDNQGREVNNIKIEVKY